MSTPQGKGHFLYIIKIFPFRRTPNQTYINRCPASLEGRFAIVTDVKRDAVDADGAADERAHLADGEVVWS